MLGALPAREAERVAEHAEGCPRCGHEARQLRSVVAKLPGDDAPPIEPPPELKQRIMAVVYAESLLREQFPPGVAGRTGR